MHYYINHNRYCIRFSKKAHEVLGVDCIQVNYKYCGSPPMHFRIVHVPIVKAVKRTDLIWSTEQDVSESVNQLFTLKS